MDNIFDSMLCASRFSMVRSKFYIFQVYVLHNGRLFPCYLEGFLKRGDISSRSATSDLGLKKKHSNGTIAIFFNKKK